jgi:thiol peroxidase
MAQVLLGENTINTVGDLPAVGSPAPDFTLAGADLGNRSMADYAGKQLVLNIFPSLDTGICAASVRRFNEIAAEQGVTVLCISNDLPMAQARFCGAEGIENVETLSGFRSSFADDYGVRILDSKMEGLMARSVVVVGADGNVSYTEQVPQIAQEPDYDAAIAAL